ncbi:MAG: hypothetical protein GY790_12255 [Bacteroidetes bacterium]|nr:hypothetical protein [Bacteroidota bacterium]
MFKPTIPLLILFIFTLSVSAQDKLVIDDRTGILSPKLEGVVSQKLLEEGISYTKMVDFSKRCEYLFTELQKPGDDLVIRVKDCDETPLGEKNLGSRIMTAPAPEQGLLIAYAILDIISDPGKYVAAPTVVTPSETTAGQAAPPRKDSAIVNEHDSRYFFAPSAYNLKKGELYYNTVYFLIHDIQYGLTDNFSMGMGTTIIGLPLYFTPKLSFPIGEKSALAIGDMLMLGTWGGDAIGNLAYGTFSTGGPNGNVTFGAGHLYTNENELTGLTSSLVTNFSAMTRISPYIFFLTENYVMSANFNKEAWYNSQSGQNYYGQVYEDYVQRNTFWYGILGIRIISKNRDFISWQMGLTYIVNFAGDIPVKFNSWDHDAREGVNMIAFPTVSFTVKFGNYF